MNHNAFLHLICPYNSFPSVLLSCQVHRAWIPLGEVVLLSSLEPGTPLRLSGEVFLTPNLHSYLEVWAQLRPKISISKSVISSHLSWMWVAHHIHIVSYYVSTYTESRQNKSRTVEQDHPSCPKSSQELWSSVLCSRTPAGERVQHTVDSLEPAEHRVN